MSSLTQRRRAPGEEPLPDDADREPPFLDLTRLEAQARGVLEPSVFDYYAGGAETETTLTEAPLAWRSWRLRPRVLRGVDDVDLSTTLLGSPVATPVGVAPWAYQAMAHPEGELATARGAAATGSLMCVSTSANHTVEEVAAVEPASPKWYQLYRLHSVEHTADLATRAGQAGYRALVLTVDLPLLGRRRRDLVHDFALPADLRMANHPTAYDRPGLSANASATWTFDDIGRYAELSGLPVVVKGVLRGDDAARCVKAGASAVWVSTHGGRQVDPAIASAHALPEVVEAVRGETVPDGSDVEVYADGGVRTGSDVLTALALGARAVFLGRPITWGLATGGAAGVSRVLAGLTGELAHTMALCGLAGLSEVTPDTVVRTG